MNKHFLSHKVMAALLISLTAYLALTAITLLIRQNPKTSLEMTLSRPSFLSYAEASSNLQMLDIGAKLDDEAGFSAYFKAPGPIDLNLVRNALRVVEIQTPQYIIGSVDVPDYPEFFDAHIYVSVDGWMLSYYLRADPPSKVIDTRAKNLNSTVLEKALAVVAGAVGAPFSSASLYDFRYPDATHILLVNESYSDGRCFNITLPSNYGYFDRGWAVYRVYSGNSFKLDGTFLPQAYGDDSYDIYYGTISASQLLPDTAHQICVEDALGKTWGVLMILYREQ